MAASGAVLRRLTGPDADQWGRVTVISMVLVGYTVVMLLAASRTIIRRDVA